jgi:hypothetical protein
VDDDKDDKVSLRYDYSRLIVEGPRYALDQAEETVAARLNVRTIILDISLAGSAHGSSLF